VIRRRVEKLVADPAQVLRILLRQRDARPDAGMDEQEVAAAEAVAQALQEQFVGAGKGADEGLLQVECRVAGAERDAELGGERRQARRARSSDGS